MKRLFASAALVIASGCTAVITPEGTYLEPLPIAVTVAPHVIAVAPAPVVVERIRPLPPVYLEPDRYLYSYSGLYYHYWDGGWYYGPEKAGPWHSLPKQYYPSRVYRGPRQIPPGQMKER